MKIARTVVLLLAVTALRAEATEINAPLPSDAYIQLNGYDWAWALPIAAGANWFGRGSSLDLSYQGTQGWRLPTQSEMALAPVATDFVFAGANVPASGTDPVSGATFFGGNSSAAACATPYFTNDFVHCDYNDAATNGFAPPGATNSLDQLVIRNEVNAPEPGSLTLLAVGIAALSRRRRRVSS